MSDVNDGEDDVAAAHRHVREFAGHAHHAVEIAAPLGEPFGFVMVIATEHATSVVHTFQDEEGNPLVVEAIANLMRAAKQIAMDEGGIDAETFDFRLRPLFPDVPDPPA